MIRSKISQTTQGEKKGTAGKEIQQTLRLTDMMAMSDQVFKLIEEVNKEMSRTET